MIRFFEQLTLFTLIFFIPLQMRKILYSWNPGGFNEYLNVYLYATDLFIFLLIMLWLARVARRNSQVSLFKGRLFAGRRSITAVALCFFVAGAFSLTGALNLGLGFYQLLKLGEFLLLFMYFFTHAKALNYRILARIFVAGGIIQSLWATLQFFTQSDLGLKIFQESPLNPDLPYVANFFVGDDKIIRAYGGFPHPNVLAAFLLAALFLLPLVFWGQNQGGKLKPRGKVDVPLFLGAGFFILLLGLILTFSRIALVVYAAGGIAFFIFFLFSKTLWRCYGKEVLRLALIGIISTALLFIIFFPYLNARFHVNPQEEAVVNRVRYSEESAQQIHQSPVLGVGVGNFVPTFKASVTEEREEFYQPVHNIYLLIASELGIVGLLFFFCLIGLVFLKSGKALLQRKISPDAMLPLACYGILFSSFLILGLFDHFFWTLQQGRLLFWIIAGILVGLASDASRDESHT